MDKAFNYMRYSSNNQREESIEAQLRYNVEYAKKNNMNIVGQYIDRAETATNDNREDFQKMINLLVVSKNSMGIKYIIVHKFDRIFRDRYDSSMYKRKLKLLGIKVVSVLEHMDDSPESVILESVLEGMAEYYSLNLARETMKGMCENAYKAKFNGGIPPYGYLINDKKEYEINPSEAITVRQIFSDFAKVVGYKTISKQFNKSTINSIYT